MLRNYSLMFLFLMAGPGWTQDPQSEWSAGFQRLRFLEGSWAAVPQNPNADGSWSPQNEIQFTVSPSLGEKYLETEVHQAAYTYHLIFSFDQAQGQYRVVSYDDQSGLVDVYEGQFLDDGSLQVSNLKPGTHYLYQGQKVYNRMALKPKAQGWTWLIEASTDGQSWLPQLKVDINPK
ncbi:MAG: hypothetical protein H6510_04790 [Acidobacteria bacterium]|nr:hypothetical protein [Acidobacteriota bacterium]MCB9397113.1 hypothetical protein [Acidobacteriota bacterium]